MVQPGVAQGYAIGPNGQPIPGGQGVVVVNQGGYGGGCARRTAPLHRLCSTWLARPPRACHSVRVVHACACLTL